MVCTIKDHRKRQNIQNSSCRFEHSGVISMVCKRFFFYSDMYRVSLGNQPTFRDATTATVWETTSEIPYWWPVTTQIWVVLLIGRTAKQICLNQSEALSRSGLWHVMGKEFLKAFLRRHFAVKLVGGGGGGGGSRGAGCFLRHVSWTIARDGQRNKLRLHVILMIYTLIDSTSRSISAREIAQFS